MNSNINAKKETKETKETKNTLILLCFGWLIGATIGYSINQFLSHGLCQSSIFWFLSFIVATIGASLFVARVTGISN